MDKTITYYACFYDVQSEPVKSLHAQSFDWISIKLYKMNDPDVLFNVLEKSSSKCRIVDFPKDKIYNPFLLNFTNSENEKYIIAKYYREYEFSGFLVHEQSQKKCFEVVREDGLNLRYVKNQTTEICLAAMANNPDSEKYVKIKLNVKLDYLLNMIENLGIVNSGCIDIL